MTLVTMSLALGFTYTQPSDIPIGQSRPFELFLTSASIPISQNRPLQISNYLSVIF